MTHPSAPPTPAAPNRRRAWLGVQIIGGGLLLAACAAPRPMVVNPTFVGTAPHVAPPSGTTANPRQLCHVDVVELADARRAPEVLGVATGRAVKAPDDRGAWLRSIVGGLASRGFAVDFDQGAGASSDAVAARVRLQVAWVTDTGWNYTANVVLHVQAAGPGGPAIDRDYRGAHTSTNWASAKGELQGVLDHAFAKALDAIATDLRPLCPA